MGLATGFPIGPSPKSFDSLNCQLIPPICPKTRYSYVYLYSYYLRISVSHHEFKCTKIFPIVSGTAKNVWEFGMILVCTETKQFWELKLQASSSERNMNNVYSQRCYSFKTQRSGYNPVHGKLGDVLKGNSCD